MQAGLLTVEQARVVIDVLGPFPAVLADTVWRRLLTTLEADARAGSVRPPARVREALGRWIVKADPAGAAGRRRQAEWDSADVRLWQRRDGLFDLVGSGGMASRSRPGSLGAASRGSAT